MRRTSLALALTALGIAGPARPVAQTRPVAAGPEIKLVLLIAVDQFRNDYLTRFRSDYTGGLSLLLTRGANFTQAQLEHYPTVTAVGHSTMLSGALPSVSGIIGNDWYDRTLGASVTSVSDPDTTLVGGTGAGSSPRRLLVSTLGDEMKNAVGHLPEERQPKVLGLSLKDRSAILPAGHRADAAYWLDVKTGTFVTSSYYRPAAHPWVDGFNGTAQPASYAGKRWDFLVPAPGSGHTMPVAPGTQLYSAVYASPYGNELLRDLALLALEREQLGQRGATDLLSVSFSSNDAVGHTFGPDSPEVRDMAVRTDRMIGELLARVDALVGLDHTIVAFTTDHGVAPVPEMQAARKLPGGRLKQADLFGPIAAALTTKYGEGNWILATAGTSPYLNYALIAEKGLDAVEVRRVAASAAAAVPHVARVYTRDQLLGGAVAPDLVGQRIGRSYNQVRSGDLEIVLEPYWLRSSSGTTHGTPYSFDAHIPLLLMGPGIKSGAYYTAAALNDLAPTLAAIIGVETPSGSSGRVLLEALVPTAAPAKARGTQ